MTTSMDPQVPFVTTPVSPAPYGAPPPAAKRHRWPWLAAIVVLVLAASSGAYLLLRGPDTFAVAGTLAITDLDGYTSTGSGCKGDGGYGDIHEGAQVTVTDADGTVLAVGQLVGTPKTIGSGCKFAFAVTGVPRGESIYGISIGGQQRGTLRYPEAALVDKSLDLTLG